MDIAALDMSDPTLMEIKKRYPERVITLSNITCYSHAKILDVNLKPGSMNEWSKPYLHTVMSVDGFVPEVELPYGVQAVRSTEKHGLLCHGYYNFNREQLTELVKKGLFTPQFKQPLGLIESEWDIPLKADFAIVKPNLDNSQYDYPIVYMDVTELGAVELSLENTEVDLTEYFEHVPEFDDETYEQNLTQARDHDVEQEISAAERGRVRELAEGENLFSINYDALDGAEIEDEYENEPLSTNPYETEQSQPSEPVAEEPETVEDVDEYAQAMEEGDAGEYDTIMGVEKPVKPEPVVKETTEKTSEEYEPAIADVVETFTESQSTNLFNTDVEETTVEPETQTSNDNDSFAQALSQFVHEEENIDSGTTDEEKTSEGITFDDIKDELGGEEHDDVRRPIKLTEDAVYEAEHEKDTKKFVQTHNILHTREDREEKTRTDHEPDF